MFDSHEIPAFHQRLRTNQVRNRVWEDMERPLAETANGYKGIVTEVYGKGACPGPESNRFSAGNPITGEVYGLESRQYHGTIAPPCPITHAR